jgi:MobA/MobL family
MAIFHVDASYIRKGTSKGGAKGFAGYLTGHATRLESYLKREGHGGREDLVAHGTGALPRWAKDGEQFFRLADRYERSGGVVARHYQVTIPRELSASARLELAEDIRRVFFERYPHVWAVHNPSARDGSGEQPHLHVMFSTRREDTHSDRAPQHWFARAANRGQDPLSGGVRKDGVWDRKAQLQGVRMGCATLINAALDREGHIGIAVSQERVDVRGLGRGGVHYDERASAEAIRATQERRQILHRDYFPLENALNVLAWQQQKTREHLTDLSREAIVDHVRDHFWRQDRSPQREQERQESLLRTLARQVPLPQRQREPVRTSLHRPRVWGHGWGLDDTMQQGVTPPMAHEREHER